MAATADMAPDFANCDHEASAKAISKGLSQRSSRSYWIHTSGTGILTWETIDKECYGEELPRVFDDMDGVGELTNQPDRALHRGVDKVVLAASAGNPHVKTAIVCPPTIYGPGRGPDNQRSQQAYTGARCILEQGGGFMPGKGRNIWHEVHVQDLSNLYLLLGEAAVAGGGKATWNEQGYYLAENGAFAWGDVFKAMTKIAHGMGLLPSDECRGIEASDLWNILPYGPLMWGTNSRGVSQRGKTLLGWEPVQKGLMQALPDIVRGEAAVLFQERGLKATPI
jgi:nucleoside-diphosphate-sugar epimerase